MKSPLFDKNYNESGIITPEEFIRARRKKNSPPASVPPLCILGFFPQLYTFIRKNYQTEAAPINHNRNPCLLFEKQNIQMSYIFPGRGAPIAGAVLDETIALGAKKIIIIGIAGYLGENVPKGLLCVPDAAIRDEGTSCHYLPPAFSVEPDRSLVQDIRHVLDKKHQSYQTGPTWTTDGFYRETPSRIRTFRNRGVLTVDMEAAALFSIASFYGIKIAAMFRISDALTPDSWQPNLKPDAERSVSPTDLLQLAVSILIYSEKKKKKREKDL